MPLTLACVPNNGICSDSFRCVVCCAQYDQLVELGQVQGETDDTSCGLEEEGQAADEEAGAADDHNKKA